MTLNRLLLLVSASLALSSCDAGAFPESCPLPGEGECYEYRAFDEVEQEVAAGFVRLTDPGDGTVSGSWRFSGNGNGHPVGVGVLVGSRSGGSVRLELYGAGSTPGAELAGAASGGRLEGVWTAVGPQGGGSGTFTGSVVSAD